MFFTPVHIPSSQIKITHQHSCLSIGSCFAENIGRKMQMAGFECLLNPFGVMFNPISIQQSIERLLCPVPYCKDDVFEHQTLWHSFDHSSAFSGYNATACVDNINKQLAEASEILKKSKRFILTFGTAWVYEHATTAKVVANCHKLPSATFVRKRITVTDIITRYSELFTRLETHFPDIQIIVSVSPVRHLKDGLHENNISKSTLLLAVEELCSKFSFVHYFPAYELVMDELRDYRYFASDMVHPSEVAIQHVWKRFTETYFEQQTTDLASKVEQLRSDLEHRPLHPNSESFKQFTQHVTKRREQLIAQYPFLAQRI